MRRWPRYGNSRKQGPTPIATVSSLSLTDRIASVQFQRQRSEQPVFVNQELSLPLESANRASPPTISRWCFRPPLARVASSAGNVGSRWVSARQGLPLAWSLMWLKCDDTKPQCLRCIKHQAQCPGYPATLTFRSETERIKRRAKVKMPCPRPVQNVQSQT